MWAEGKIPPGTSFSEAFNFGHPWGPFWHTIRERGMYIKHLKRWHQSFSDDQIRIFWYDDLVKEPLRIIKELYSWIGVDESFVPLNYNKKYNENHSGYNPVMKLEDRNMALEYYLPSIEKLEQFTGRNLSSWKY